MNCTLNDKTDFFARKDNFAADKDVASVPVFKGTDSDDKRVTIAIPTFSRPEFIKFALDSALNQVHCPDYSVIVIDNCPDENTETEKIVTSFRCDRLSYYRNEKNIGMFGNMNRCLLLPKSEWVVILHDDDMLAPDYLEKVTKVIEKITDADMISPRHDILAFNEKGDYACVDKKFYHRFEGGVCRLKLKHFTYYYPSRCTGCMLKREKAIELGGFNADFYPSSDYVFSALFASKFKVYDYNAFLYRYRVGENESANPETYKRTVLNDYYFQKFIEKQRGRKCSFFARTVEANAFRRLTGADAVPYKIDNLDFAKDIFIDKYNAAQKLYAFSSFQFTRIKKMLRFFCSYYFGGIK